MLIDDANQNFNSFRANLAPKFESGHQLTKSNKGGGASWHFKVRCIMHQSRVVQQGNRMYRPSVIKGIHLFTWLCTKYIFFYSYIDSIDPPRAINRAVILSFVTLLSVRRSSVILINSTWQIYGSLCSRDHLCLSPQDRRRS